MKIIITVLTLLTLAGNAQTNDTAKGAPAPIAAPRATSVKRSVLVPAPIPAIAMEPQRIRVTAVLANYGFLKCSTDRGDMMISHLPPTVAASLASLKQMDARIENLEFQIRADTKEAREADAVAPTSASGDIYYVEAQMAKREQANLLAAKVENKKDDLELLKKKRAELNAKTIGDTTILAIQTPQKYAGLNVWRYIGPAPKEEKEEKTEQPKAD